ncbi:zinc finger FYVE domain-containing protein 26-like isoform X2 [Asterias amurensis]|uniref:zinc finger FYVE domain-containing protein 26-like isoform X2 n=1 Tax=Asterias amurensis TaxID=7602 RepID=UPI003AB65EF5
MAHYTPISNNTHPFGQEEEVSRQQLFVAFCNHLHLGQWELVRACARGLLEFGNAGQGTTEPDVRKVLEAVVEHPYDCSLASESLPSAYHIAWLAQQEHRNLTTDLVERLPHTLSAFIEFRLLLYNVRDCTSAAVIQDVYKLYIHVQTIHNADGLGNPLPRNPQDLLVTERLRTFLKTVIQRDAHLGNSILHQLKLPASSRHHQHNQSLQQVYLDCIMEDVSTLRQSRGDDVAKIIARIYKVLSMLDPTENMKDLQVELLFLNVLNLTRAPYNLLRIPSLYSSLLGRDTPYLIKEFCRLEGRERIEELNGELRISNSKLEVLSQELRITLRLAQMADRELAWKEMFHCALLRERHVLANVVDTSLSFIRDGMYDELVTLLSPDEFAPLKPLVLLLGWNYVYSCDSANNLLDALHEPSKATIVNEPLLDQACGKLTHQVQLVQWCLEKTKPLLVASGADLAFDPKVNEMFHSLDSRSVLHMLDHAINLTQLDTAEVFDILSKKPQLETKPSKESNKSGGKSVHFEDPREMSIEQERDIAIYRSFLAIKNCMTALSNSTQCKKPPVSPKTKKQGVSREGLAASKTGDEAQGTVDGTARQPQHAATSASKDSSGSDSRCADSEHVDSWDRSVVQHLQEARHQLSLLYPLTYRVEILENVFSLLFVRSEDAFVGKAVMSDSGGEEGHVDEEWQNRSVVSIESITPKNEDASFELAAQPRVVQSAGDAKVPRLNQEETIVESASAGFLETMMNEEKRDRTSSGSIVAKRSNTSETHSQHSFNMAGGAMIGFVAGEDIIDALLSMLKDCLADLSEARYSLAGPSASVGILQEAGGSLMKYMHCSVSTSSMAQRISLLTQRINEAWWRYRLVSQATNSQSAAQWSSGGSKKQGDSSSDEGLYTSGFHREKEDSKEEKKQSKKVKHRHNSRSRSASEGSNSSAKQRRKRRRRHRRSDAKLSSSERGVVARMLSSQDTLLRMCLHRGTYAQALQVVKMFELEDKPEVSEVYFAEHWEHTVRRLQSLDTKVSKMTSTSVAAKPRLSPSSSIGKIAASGTASLSVSGVVDDLLATSHLPLLPTTPLVNSGQHEKHSSVATMLKSIQMLNVAGVVIFDLACTACISWKASTDLLDVAKGRLQLGLHSLGEYDQSYKARSPPQSAAKLDPLQLLVGVLPFVHQINNLIAPISADSTALIRQDILEEFYQRSASEALLQATRPLDAVTLRAQINTILEHRKAVMGFSRAIKTDSKRQVPFFPGSSNELDASLSSANKGQSMVHQAMRYLLQTFDKSGSSCQSLVGLLAAADTDQSMVFSNYLMSLYSHVSVLSSLLVEAKDWHPGHEQPLHSGGTKAVNPFCVLEESPTYVLGKLMFQNQIPPTRLEGVADQLKLNLVHVIVRSCCPTIPMQPIKETRRPRSHSVPSRPSGHVILNDPGEETRWIQEPRHPTDVAEELLSRMITLMKTHATTSNHSKVFDLRASVLACCCQDFLDISEATRELSYVDLDLLETANQKLGFFVNVMNLLLAHASLYHIYQQLISKDVMRQTSSHTRHSSLTERLHFEDEVALPGTSSRQISHRITYLNKVAYCIGQLGRVTAFELRYAILRAGLHPPSCFNNLLQHRLHALSPSDPWHKYLPPAETRLLFVISSGCQVSPILEVMRSEDVEGQLEVAMQRFLENYVIIDEEKLKVTIPKQLDWFRKDFTGKSLGIDIEQGHIYGGLLNVVAPHMSNHMGEKLESYVLSCSPGHIQLEEKTPLSGGPADRPLLNRGRSFRFTVRIEPYDFSYGYKFDYHSTPTLSTPQTLKHKRSSSQPENLASVEPLQSLPHPTFSMTESTMAYLHSKSKLVASLAGLISVAVDERPDRFALKKSFESSGSLTSPMGTPKSLVFDEGAFGEDREYHATKASSRVEMAKVLQHVMGYSTMQRYVETYLSSVVETAEAVQSEANGYLPESLSAAMTLRDAHSCTLANHRSDHYQAMMSYTLDYLVTHSNWMEALQLIEALPKTDSSSDWLPDLPIIRDFILCCAAQADLPQKSVDILISESWRSLLCLHDKDLCSRVTLGLLPRLPVSVCLQLLNHCVAHPASGASLRKAVCDKLEQMKTYNKITEYAQVRTSPLISEDESDPNSVALPSPYTQWQRVAADSVEDPSEVLDVMLSAGDFDLAKRWAVLHGVYHALKEAIHEKHLQHLLRDGSNTLIAYQILEHIPDKLMCLQICQSLLAEEGPEDRISLASTVFLIQFMMDHFLDKISMEEMEELQALSLGVKALLCLPEPERSECEDLVSKPMLILEQLLMNTKIEHASAVLDCLRRELQTNNFRGSELSLQSCDALVAKYAKKAIQLVVAVQSPPQDLDCTIRPVSSLSVTSPTGHRRSRGRLSVSSMLSTVSSPTSPSSSQAIPVPSERGPSPTPSVQSVSRGLSPRGQSPRVTSSSRRSSLSTVSDAVSITGSIAPSTIAPIQEGLPTSPPKRDSWVPDTKVTHCMVCKDERFSMFNRRHHCRRCGRVVCWRCSQLKAVVEGYGDTPVRVCDQCYQAFIMPRPQHGNSSSQILEQRLKVRHPGSRRQSPSCSRGTSPSFRVSPNSWQQRTPVPGSSLTSGHSGGSETLYMEIMEWKLTLDNAMNTFIREDFYYEQAPSTSVCLSILDLHSDPRACGALILQMCRDLSEYLRPIRPGVPNPEVDYNLIISMMKTLLFNAKLKFMTDGDSSSIELCDSYQSFIDLLSLFVSSNSADIPSIQQLSNTDLARQVRDRLVLAERLSLASEVSTKCMLDTSAVWSAWGMSCLRAGDYQGAREKFVRILKAPSEKNSMSPASKLVTDIIQHLETSASQADTVQAILNASASSIRDFIAEPQNASFSSSAALDNPALQECHYYINTYCPHITMVNFYRRHNRLPLAVSYILSQHCSSDVFLEGLLVPCIKHGNLHDLQSQMLHQDPTLNAWNQYLTASCRYLNTHSLAHVLYDVQLFMKDFVRASMTCIKFYQSGARSYSDLFDRLQYLTKAKIHMKAVFEEKEWESVPRPPMATPSPKASAPSWGPASDVNIRLMMSVSQLTNHMNTITLQIKVTKFLHGMLSSGKTSLSGSAALTTQGASDSIPQLPTLFGNSKVKAEVAYRVVLAGSSVNDGFQLAFQIIQDFRLPDTLIYSKIGRNLATQHKYKDIQQLLTCVRGTGLSNDQCCDEILDACVRVLANDGGQAKEVEGLIKLIKSDTNKINALMLCGKLKSAYLIAVKAERVEDVERILHVAQRAGPSQAQMRTICETWLASQQEKRKREMKTKELLMRSKQDRR